MFWIMNFTGIYTDDAKHDHVIDKQKLISAFKGNSDGQLKLEHHEINDSDGRFEETGSGKWHTSWSQQFFVLLRRDIKERKYESFSGLRIGQVLVVAIISGLLWYKSDTSHMQDQVIPDSGHSIGTIGRTSLPNIVFS